MLRGLAVAALIATVAVPAASAKSAAVKLSVLPLPKAQLGAAAKSLALAHDSGVVSNVTAAYNTTAATPGMIAKLGRVTGYTLDYGDVYGSGTGVVAVQTGADLYKTAADAKKGIAFWKEDDPRKVATLSHFGLQATASTFTVPKLGAARFGALATITISGLSALRSADVQIADGKYVLYAQVSSASASSAKSLATKFAKALEARLHLALLGKLRAAPVKLPAKLQAGAPAGGPDLGTLALTSSDFTGTATVDGSGYSVDVAALSAYAIDFRPAGQFDELTQLIEWYPTAGDATYLAGLEEALLAYVGGGQVTPVDLSSVGDNANGALVQFTSNGSTVYLAVVALSRGQASDIALAAGQSPIQASDVQSLAQTTANHLNAGVTG